MNIRNNLGAFEAMPDEVMRHIFSYVDINTVARGSELNKFFYQLTSENCLWESLIPQNTQVAIPKGKIKEIVRARIANSEEEIYQRIQELMTPVLTKKGFHIRIYRNGKEIYCNLACVRPMVDKDYAFRIFFPSDPKFNYYVTFTNSGDEKTYNNFFDYCIVLKDKIKEIKTSTYIDLIHEKIFSHLQTLNYSLGHYS